MKSLQIRRKWWVVLLAGLLTLALAGGALAAEFAGDEDVYRLGAGEVVGDDLYVASGEVYIDGTVKGDLYTVGGYIEINGTVEGDLAAAGGGIVINGQVLDDVRVAGGGIELTGAVGDDLFVAGGGGQGMIFPTGFGGTRSIPQGIRVGDASTVGGDGVITGGSGRIGGSIAGDLWASVGTLELAGRVDGNAELQVGSLRVDEGSSVGGTFRYTSPEETSIPPGVSGAVRYEAPADETEQPTSVLAQIVGWIVRTALILAGFAILGWLLLRYAPGLLRTPIAAIEEKPLEAGLYGLLAAALFVFVPILSGLLVVLMGIFWGTFPALGMALFLFGTLALLWLFSPLITGLWLGQRIVSQMGRETTAIITLLVGVLLIVVIGRIPLVGGLVYLVSFALALGGVLRSWQAGKAAEVPAVSA